MSNERSAFTSRDTYERTIGDSPEAHSYIEDVDPFTVELRVLDAGDRAKVRDALAMERDDGAGGFALGTVELLHVKAAIVSWTLGAPIDGYVERLRPAVLEAIREHVSYGDVPATPPTKAERDANPPPKPSAEAREATGRHLHALEDDELRDEEKPGSVPLPSS